jgi:hypothetical protein
MERFIDAIERLKSLGATDIQMELGRFKFAVSFVPKEAEGDKHAVGFMMEAERDLDE